MNNKQTHAQVTIEDINSQLRDMYKNLKRSPDSVPFLFDMSSHVIDDKLYRSVNDSDYISKGLFLTMYEEMRSAAYDTSIMEPSEIIEERMRKRSRNDTVNISILNADYATFLDDAFMNEGQYYNLTDTTINDVANRTIEPFLLKNVFVSTLTTPVSYFRKVIYRIDSSFVFSKREFHGITNRDLDPDYARWKIDFGEGGGWREFDPLVSTNFLILYPDTGAYDISIAVFYCDPYPMCNTYPSKLSKTSIYILNNAVPKDPDLTYDNFPNITVGLYKGCGEMKGGVYIPQKPFIIVEGIDLLNTRSIQVLYDENVQVNSSKKLGLLAEYNYDFYIVNFNDTHLDMRENAQGIVALLDYLKSIMNTNEQFVVFAESMGGIIARYALTYMENDLYTQNPNANKPTQMHNTRLYISNDAPHQGATVPIAFQTFYRNLHKAFYFKVLKEFASHFPLLSEEKYWRNVLNSTSVQQLLAYHIDANGPHPNRIEFMDDLIALNPQTNGYPAYTKMMAFTDGLLSGQHQLTLDNNIMQPGMDILNLDVKVQLVVFKWMKINLIEEKLALKSVDMSNPTAPLVVSNTKVLYRKSRACLKHLLRGNIGSYVNCVFNPKEEINSIPQINITSNYDSDPAGIFSILSMLSSVDGFQNHFKFPFNAETFVNSKTGFVKFNLTTSPFLPLGYLKSKNLEVKLKLTNFGIAFIPVQSAIDFDYYKTVNISADYNLLSHNVQDFLLAYSPFHVISGFNFRGNDYPIGASESKNNKNWSHGFINNTELDNVKNELFLNREIGDHTLYLNNLNINTRNADFNTIKINNGFQNPYYTYIKDGFDNYPNSTWFIYSKLSPFVFKEPSIVNIYYEDLYNVGNYLLNEGLLYVNQKSFKPCNTKHVKITNINYNKEVLIYPNPFEDKLLIENLQSNEKYNIRIYNMVGENIQENNICSNDEGRVEINIIKNLCIGFYLLEIYSNNNFISKIKLTKTY
jgi:hypothetical protein